ncbi:O-antigen translocase [Gammaproteobacteria bacterium]|nr:O-antigen translocase [Gammaproteobacteria bacterium]
MTSHRQAFRSSAIIGGASVINMVIGIVKVKVLAVLLGPAGIGLMGLYQNIMGMASTLAACGMGNSGVRQLAASANDAETLSIVRRALLLGSLMLGITGMALLWLLREPVAQWVFGDRAHASEVGWLGVGLLLTLIAGSQTALLQGLRRIDDLARVSILSALVGAAVGILAVYLLGKDGVLWFVLTAPAANILVASYYAARLPHPQVSYDLAAIQRQWLAMLKLGIPLMSAGFLTLTTQLAVRSIVLRELGLEASGYFQASWAISMIYVGLVLNAMVMDYFPRLTTAIGDHERAGKLVNEQSEMALLLAGPMLMAMITLAPWVIHLLYAQSFSPAAEILKWQVLGDIFKVASLPIVFIFLATGRGGVYIGIQMIWSAAYLVPVVLGIREFGLVMAGVGFWVAYLIYYLVVAIVANRLIGFKPTRRNRHFTLLLLFAGVITMSLAACSTTAGYATGLLATLLVSVYSFRRLDHLIGLIGWLRQKFL